MDFSLQTGSKYIKNFFEKQRKKIFLSTKFCQYLLLKKAPKKHVTLTFD